MKKFLVILFLVFSFNSALIAKNGIITIKSSFNTSETADRLESILKENGMTVFIRINHSEGAMKAGKKLKPTILIIFGNPKIGTDLMMTNRLAAIDLPQKALIWEDEKGVIWLSYNDPNYLKKRHGLEKNKDIIIKIKKALKSFTEKAAKSE